MFIDLLSSSFACMGEWLKLDPIFLTFERSYKELSAYIGFIDLMKNLEAFKISDLLGDSSMYCLKR
jgi:hypothetical protein